MQEKIIQLLCEVKENQNLAKSVTGETKIIDEIGLDSLEMINFILRLQEEFDIEIDFESLDISVLETVNTLENYIKSNSIKNYNLV